MFICDKCLLNYEPLMYEWMYPRSYGPCEDCQEAKVCSDIHHSELIAKDKRDNRGPQPPDNS